MSWPLLNMLQDFFLKYNLYFKIAAILKRFSGSVSSTILTFVFLSWLKYRMSVRFIKAFGRNRLKSNKLAHIQHFKRVVLLKKSLVINLLNQAYNPKTLS